MLPNLIGGKTLYSFFRINPLKPHEAIVKTREGDVFIFDEISMCDSKIIHQIMDTQKFKCFIMIGDLCQLPPVKSKILSCDLFNFKFLVENYAVIPRFKDKSSKQLASLFRNMVEDQQILKDTNQDPNDDFMRNFLLNLNQVISLNWTFF